MTFNDEVVEAYKAGRTMRQQGGRMANNPYPPVGDPTVPPTDRGGILRHYWSQGYQSALPVVDLTGD